MKTLETVVQNFSYRGRNFSIVKHEGLYCAIDHKYLDENGMVTQQLTGGQMAADRTLRGCIEGMKNQLDMSYYMERGMSRAEAFCKVFNLDVNDELVADLFA